MTRCPYGWCGRDYPSGKAASAVTLKRHADCKVSSARMHERDERERALLAAGRMVRYSACGVQVAGLPWGAVVHVLFKYLGPTGSAPYSTAGRYMSKATYRALPGLEPWTPEDYAAHGPVIEAPDDFDHKHDTPKPIDAAALGVRP